MRELKRAVEAMRDPEQKETTECMLVVMVALEVGANVDRLVERTGYKRDFIENISFRMRKAGLWVGELVDDREWSDQSLEPLLGIAYQPGVETALHTPGDVPTQEHCQGSDGTQAGGSVVLDVAEWV